MAGVRGAIVLATSAGALEVVAGLPLAARAVLALRAAGLADLAVLDPGRSRPLRGLLAARGVGVRWLVAPSDALDWGGSDPVLVLTGAVLLDGEVLLPLLATALPGAVAVAQGSERVAAALCPRASVPALLAELTSEPGGSGGLGGAPSLAAALGRAGVAPGPAAPLGEGLLALLDPAHPPAVLEQMLLDRLAGRTAVGDSYLAAVIDRRLSRRVTRLLLRWPLTPSQITLASLIVGLAGAAGLATVSYAGRLAGVLGLIASVVLDCVDGEVARARYEQSAAGARLDVIGDYAVNLATFAGLAVGLGRQGLPPAGGWAALGLVAGVGAAMAVMHVLFVRPALRRGGDLHWAGDAESLRGTRVAAVVEKLASRDYTYLLLILALVGHLEWFLYAAAAGSWVFVAGLLGYWGYRALGRVMRRRSVASG